MATVTMMVGRLDPMFYFIDRSMNPHYATWKGPLPFQSPEMIANGREIHQGRSVKPGDLWPGRVDVNGCGIPLCVKDVAAGLARGEDPNFKDRNGRTALHWACDAGHTAVVKALLQGKAYTEIKAICPDVASHRGHDERVHEPKFYSRTPLHIAAYRGNLKIVEALLNAKAEVNAKEDQTSATPLHFAAAGRPAIVALLLQANADIEAEAHDRRSLSFRALFGHTNKPLKTALMNNDVASAQLLRAAGAKEPMFGATLGKVYPIMLPNTRCCVNDANLRHANITCTCGCGPLVEDCSPERSAQVKPDVPNTFIKAQRLKFIENLNKEGHQKVITALQGGKTFSKLTLSTLGSHLSPEAQAFVSRITGKDPMTIHGVAFTGSTGSNFYLSEPLTDITLDSKIVTSITMDVSVVPFDLYTVCIGGPKFIELHGPMHAGNAPWFYFESDCEGMLGPIQEQRPEALNNMLLMSAVAHAVQQQ